jgi:signal transduction histidine kinase
MLRIKPVDLLIALVVLAAQTAPFLFTDLAPGEEHWTGAGFLPVAGTALATLFRRQTPVLALLATGICIVAYGEVDSGPAQPIWYGALVCMFTVGLLASRKQQVVAVAISLSGLVAVGSLATMVRELLMWSTAFVLGLTMRARQELAKKAAELAAEQERTRIGRDLHDILGHAVSLMIVQAEAGAAVAGKDPARAEAALDTIADAGRTAMQQLRTTVGGLRGAPLEPQPGLGGLPALVAGAGHDGLTVSFHELGTARPLPQSTQLALYRVTQEALTNVVKHAHASQAEVCLDWTVSRLAITDNGRGVSGGGHRGQGLIGMRERVAAAGGLLNYGPRSDGPGFHVEAVFS